MGGQTQTFCPVPAHRGMEMGSLQSSAHSAGSQCHVRAPVGETEKHGAKASASHSSLRAVCCVAACVTFAGSVA